MLDPLWRCYFTPAFAAAMDRHVRAEFPRLRDHLTQAQPTATPRDHPGSQLATKDARLPGAGDPEHERLSGFWRACGSRQAWCSRRATYGSARRKCQSAGLRLAARIRTRTSSSPGAGLLTSVSLRTSGAP